VSTAEARSEADDSFFIVGVGASAGGVEALEHLFASMPDQLEAAFVVITHLSAHRESLLAEIIGRRTKMPVVNALHGAYVQAGHIYVLPAEHVLTLQGSELILQHLDAGQRERNPIDVFFASIAKQWQERSVGIVLSGAGTDGTLGIKAIKEEGGLTIAQGHGASGPAYDSMPSSAVASGLVDLVLTVEEIGTKLQQYVRSLHALDAIADEHSSAERHDGALQEIHADLRKRIGHDFRSYKEKTFLRRVHRRMQVRQVGSLQHYLELLRSDADETRLLFRDLLIGVTAFFRDAEAFAALESEVIPRLFEHAGAGDTIRVWVPGCATGEEAYSISLLLREHMSKLDVVPKVQVFATDIDEPALAVARAGRYPAPMLENVSPERLQRFFRADAQSYVLAKEVRDLCIFSAHSVIRDPPFSRMDMVSCRNLLIYFNAELQDNVLPVFHYALKPNGYLFLGPAESISRHVDLFSAVDKKHRLFQRRASLVTTAVRIPNWAPRGGSAEPNSHTRGNSPHYEQRLRRHIETSVLEQFTPAHIVVDADGNIIYYSARTGKYLEPQMGSPSRQIQAMARRELRLELRTTLREAVTKRHTIVRERVEVELDERVQLVRLTVQPFIQADQDPLYLIVFTDLGRPLTREEASQQQLPPVGSDVASLEHELRETRDRLQSTIEEYETALEELKSGNEELVSVNEELQSTNEELETSKEELQSVNEELNTVNNELAGKVDELDRSNADLRNLFESTQIATVFLDHHLIIRSFTPAVTAIFNLIPTDRGRPILDIAHQLVDVDIAHDVRRVLDEQKPIERPVRLRSGRVFHLMRILPYRTSDERIDGVLVTFVNVTDIVAAEEQLRTLVSELNHRVRNMLQVVIGLANQTMSRSTDVQQFEKAFMGRMQSLARAYELLSRGGWQEVSVADLLNIQLAPFAAEGNRCTVEGEKVMLTANAALALGLVLYELATNATKYGALSVPDGRVDISWRLERRDDKDPVLIFSWRERGGPTVSEPARHGFGTELLQRQLRYELNGNATMDFHQDGLRVLLEIPVHGSIVA
jgi:two-component system, chemotaxis family, CheB/CheR fusion protein